MKRPQSAKVGYRGPAYQNSSNEDIRDEEPNKYSNRRQVKLIKPDFATNDFSRIMPKKIFQDKERLYSEGLQLKQKLNDIQQENLRLKTRISILEKEKDKLTKAIDAAAEVNSKSQSRFKAYQIPAKPSDVESSKLRNITKMLKQSKEESDFLRQQNIKIKKAVKFTKINEVEIECKILREEYQKLQDLLTDMNDKLTDQEEYDREIEELKAYLEQQAEENKDLSDANENYQQYIEELEEKLKKESERNKDRETRLQRETALHKRKLNEAIKTSDELRKQVKTLKQACQNVETKKKQMVKNIVRPQTSNPYKGSPKQQQPNLQVQNKLEQLRSKNQKLEKELKEVKQKIEKADKENKKCEKNEKISLPRKSENYDEDFENVGSPEKNTTTDNFLLKEQTIVKPDLYDEDDFEEDTNTKKIDHLQNFKNDLGDQNEEEEIYKKESNQASKKQKQNGSYEPNKQILTEIKELLTYRMKAQRYPFKDLKKDISSSPYTVFTYAELEGMMKSQPFYLTAAYAKAFLEYVFERKDSNIANSEVSSSVLVTKIRKVIKDFEMLDEKEEEERLMSIAEMTTQYPSELEAAFEKIKNGPDTVSKSNLIEMFKKLELADYFIEIIIAELSLCSQDLEHLSIRGYFDRFYIDDVENSNAIDEEPIESSGEQPAYHKKIHKIDEEDEYDDEKSNFVLDQQSRRGKANNQSGELVSDDGRI